MWELVPASTKHRMTMRTGASLLRSVYPVAAALQPIHWPPFTFRTWPVTKPASSEAR